MLCTRVLSKHNTNIAHGTLTTNNFSLSLRLMVIYSTLIGRIRLPKRDNLQLSITITS